MPSSGRGSKTPVAIGNVGEKGGEKNERGGTFFYEWSL